MASSNSPMPHQSSSNQSSVPSIGSSPNPSMMLHGSSGAPPNYPVSMYPNGIPSYPVHSSSMGIMPQRFPVYCVPPFPPGQLSQLHPSSGNAAMRFLSPSLQANGGKSSPQLNVSSSGTDNAQSMASANYSISSTAGPSNFPVGPTILSHSVRGPSGVSPMNHLNRPPMYPSSYYMSQLPQQNYMQQQQNHQTPMHYVGSTPPTIHMNSSVVNGIPEPNSHHQSQMRNSNMPLGNAPSTAHSLPGAPTTNLPSSHITPQSMGMPMGSPNMSMASFNGIGVSSNSQPPGFPVATSYCSNINQSSQHIAHNSFNSSISGDMTQLKKSRSKNVNDQKSDGRSSPSKRSQKSGNGVKKSKSQKNDLQISPSPQNSMSSQMDFGDSRSFVSSPSLSLSQPSLLSSSGDKTTPGGSNSSQIMMNSSAILHNNNNTQCHNKGGQMAATFNVMTSSGMTMNVPAVSQPPIIPSHITGSARKLFAMGNEPERYSWLEHYLKFMEEIGKPIVAMPHVAKIHLDLYKLYHVVQKHGGIMEVVRRRLWKEISTVVNVNSSAAAAFTLRRNYVRYLIDYECRFVLGGIDPEPLINQIEATASKKKRKVVPQDPVAPSGSSSLDKQLQGVGNDSDFIPEEAPGSNTSHSNMTSSVNGDSGSSKMLNCTSADNSVSHSMAASEIHGTQSKSHFLEDVINEVSSGSFCLPKKLAAVISNEDVNSESSSKMPPTFPTEFSIPLDSVSTATGTSKASSCISDGASQLSLRHDAKLSSTQATFNHMNSPAVVPLSTSQSMHQSSISNASSTSSFPVSSSQQQPFPHINEPTDASAANMHSKPAILLDTSPSTHKMMTASPVPHNSNTYQHSLQTLTPLQHIQRVAATPLTSQILSSPVKASPLQYPVYFSPCVTSVSTSMTTTFQPSTISSTPAHHMSPSFVMKGPSVQSHNKVKLDSKTECRFIFPPGSVERVELSSETSRKRKLTSVDDYGSVDMWRVIMAFKSGLLAEVTWALDYLCVLTHDDNSLRHFSLSSFPNLLDHLSELFIHALKVIKNKEESPKSKPQDINDDGDDLCVTEELEKHNRSANIVGFYHDGKSRRCIQVEPRKWNDPLSSAQWKQIALAQSNCQSMKSGPDKVSTRSSQAEEYLMKPTLDSLRKLEAKKKCSSDTFCSLTVLEKEAAIARCIVLSTILRNLSSFSQNEATMASHKPLLKVLGTMLHEQHDHSVCNSSVENESLLKPWIPILRENGLVILTHLSGHIYIRQIPHQVAYPILKAVIHLINCESPEARGPLRPTCKVSSSQLDFLVTPHRLALESLSRFCVLEGNVDHVLATPAADEVHRLFNSLAHNISPLIKDQVVRELSLVILSYLSRGWEFLGTHLICNAEPNIISSLLTFLEITEMNVQEIIAKNGFQALMRNPEAIGTSLELLRRVGGLMENLGQLVVNHSYFKEEHIIRLLNLSTSRVLDHQVVRSLINLIFRIHPQSPSSLPTHECIKYSTMIPQTPVFQPSSPPTNDNCTMVNGDDKCMPLSTVHTPSIETAPSPINLVIESSSSPPPPSLSPPNVNLCSNAIPLVI